jgi:signal transduction histidine kinase
MLPLLGVIGIFLIETVDAGREQVLDAQASMAEVVASVLATTLSDNQKVLNELAAIDKVRRMEPSAAKDALDQFSRAHPNIYGLFLLDQNGNLVTSTGLDPQQVWTQESFVAAVDRSLNLGEPGVSNALNAPDARVIALTAPVRAKDQAEGEPIGVVGSLLSIDRLGSAVTPFARGDTLIAVAADGQVIAAQGADPAVDALAASTVPSLAPTGSSPHAYVDQNGVERFAVYAPVPGSTWGVMVTHPAPAAYAPNREMAIRTAAILAATVLATLAFAALAGDLMTRPLRQARSQVEALAAGDFSPREVVQSGGEEIVGISEAVGYVASHLGDQVRALEEAQEAGAAQAEQLRELNRRTVRMQEDERRRIAAEIHDAVSPLVTGALYQARALRLGGSNGSGRPAVRLDGALDSIGDLLSRAMEELHGVIFALRPPDLDDIGVVAAIERYIAQVQRSGLNARLEIEGQPPPLTPEVRLAIYRIVQEALHNALRHAAADEAVVRIETSETPPYGGERHGGKTPPSSGGGHGGETTLRVSIRDNGAGFNPQHVSRPTALGLLSMRERAAAIGATLAVTSRPGDGTTVMIERHIEPELMAPDLAERPALDALAEHPELAERPVSSEKSVPA